MYGITCTFPLHIDVQMIYHRRWSFDMTAGDMRWYLNLSRIINGEAGALVDQKSMKWASKLTPKQAKPKATMNWFQSNRQPKATMNGSKATGNVKLNWKDSKATDNRKLNWKNSKATDNRKLNWKDSKATGNRKLYGKDSKATDNRKL